MFNSIFVAFKKLLGKGRAFLTPKGFTNEFYEIFIKPFSDLKEKIYKLRFSHFPTKFVNTDDIKNGEELFGVDDMQGRSDFERAENVESQWRIFSGTQNYKQLENLLQKKGLPVRVIENIPISVLPVYGQKIIGNGLLRLKTGMSDPVIISTGKYTFILIEDGFMSLEQIDRLVEIVVKNKPAQNAIYYLPRFLRKKEIHHVLTKAEMETYRKNQYCDVGTEL